LLAVLRSVLPFCSYRFTRFGFAAHLPDADTHRGLRILGCTLAHPHPPPLPVCLRVRFYAVGFCHYMVWTRGLQIYVELWMFTLRAHLFACVTQHVALHRCVRFAPHAFLVCILILFARYTTIAGAGAVTLCVATFVYAFVPPLPFHVCYGQLRCLYTYDSHRCCRSTLLWDFAGSGSSIDFTFCTLIALRCTHCCRCSARTPLIAHCRSVCVACVCVRIPLILRYRCRTFTAFWNLFLRLPPACITDFAFVRYALPSVGLPRRCRCTLRRAACACRTVVPRIWFCRVSLRRAAFTVLGLHRTACLCVRWITHTLVLRCYYVRVCRTRLYPAGSRTLPRPSPVYRGSPRFSHSLRWSYTGLPLPYRFFGWFVWIPRLRILDALRILHAFACWLV